MLQIKLQWLKSTVLGKMEVVFILCNVIFILNLEKKWDFSEINLQSGFAVIEMLHHLELLRNIYIMTGNKNDVNRLLWDIMESKLIVLSKAMFIY